MHFKNSRIHICSLLGSALSILPIASSAEDQGSTDAADYASDEAFLKKHTDLIVLQNGDSAVAVVPAYQGRVMTSTFDRKVGPSFGWINRKVIEKGLLSAKDRKGKLEEEVYIFWWGGAFLDRVRGWVVCYLFPAEKEV